MDTPVIFDSGVDTWVSSTDPVTDHSGMPYAPMLKDVTVYAVREGVGDIPTGAGVGTWPWTFTAAEDFDGTVTLHVLPFAAPWQAGMGYADLPAYRSVSPIVFTGTLLAGQTATVDIAPFVSSVAGGVPWYGAGVERIDTGTQGSLCTLSAPPDAATGNNRRPVLLGEWQISPDAPTNLCPAMGQAVGETLPTLTADFGSVDIASLEVQISASAAGFDPTTGIPTPDWDSGVVLTTDPELDLKTTDFTGFTGSVVYWTMQVTDTAGKVSQWADPVSCRYEAKATFTITSPAFGLTGDCNPLYAWTLDSGTQTAYQVITSSDPATVLADSGLVSSAVTGYQSIPKAPLTAGGEGVVLPDYSTVSGEVRIYDDVTDRVATPGCPIYATQTASFAFADNETVPSPDDVWVVQVGGTGGAPWADFYVQLASEPQYIIFMANGRHLARIAPKNLPPPIESEGSLIYVWRWWSARPYTDYIPGAKRVDDNTASKATFFELDAMSVTGVWIGDPATGTVGWCSGIGCTFTTADQIGIMNALGNGYPMVQFITQGVKVVTLGGTITDFNGVSASDWEKALRDLWHNPNPLGFQIAYRNVSFPGIFYNFAPGNWDENPDPFASLAAGTIVQIGPASITDEPAPPVFGVTTYDFEEGTDGEAIIRYDPDTGLGTPGVIDKDGDPEYAAAAAIHGSMGFDCGWRS